MDMAAREQAFSVIGNHDDKFMRWLKGRNVKLTHGLDRTVEQYAGQGDAVRARTLAFLDTLPSHAWVDDGLFAVAHAGVREGMLGKNYPKARDFGLYGDSSGRPAADGLPERFNLGADYRGRTAVVYGHTPVAEPEWLNNTLCIDTGCVFGGKLTALRWPERELVSVPARAHAELRRRSVCRLPAACRRHLHVIPAQAGITPASASAPQILCRSNRLTRMDLRECRPSCEHSAL